MAEPGSPQVPTIPASADPLIDTTDTRPPARSRPETVSRFLIITIDDSTQSTPLNPFQLHRAVCRLGKASRVTFREDGKVEVEMETTEGAQKLLSSDALFYDSKRGTGTVSIQVSAHPTKGFAMSVITAPDLEGPAEGPAVAGAAGGWPLGSSLRRRRPRQVGGVATPRLRLVTGFKLFAVCRRVAHCSFPFSRTSILLLTSVSLTRCCLLSELSRRGFVSSSILDLTHTCTPVFGHD